jgi:hypothetical protein
VTMNLSNLQAQAIRLHKSVLKQSRRLREDRLKLGQLLAEIRERIGVKNKSGGFRGSNNGVFCEWLKSAGINVGSAYNWMGLAQHGVWKSEGFPSRERIRYWQKFDAKMRAAKTEATKIKLFKQAVEKLRKQYRLKVVIKIT